jgi:hypothetical protein
MTARKQDLLISRLNAIGSSLSLAQGALALIGLGSVGIELDRLDEYSDLDFFVIVDTGRKAAFLDDLSWLDSTAKIAYAFRNTVEGFKVLFEDGVFCEFAVFEEPELSRIPFAPGRFVWKMEGVSDALRVPREVRPPQARTAEWSLGEALTNLYVGLSRNRRGEKLSAMRLIQVCAVDRALELGATIESATAVAGDPFAPERRIEERRPELAASLPEFAQGYERNAESARAILAFLDRYFDVDPAMKRAVLELCEIEL